MKNPFKIARENRRTPDGEPLEYTGSTSRRAGKLYFNFRVFVFEFVTKNYPKERNLSNSVHDLYKY
jgi:hypothetical protein